VSCAGGLVTRVLCLRRTITNCCRDLFQSMECYNWFQRMLQVKMSHKFHPPHRLTGFWVFVCSRRIQQYHLRPWYGMLILMQTWWHFWLQVLCSKRVMSQLRPAALCAGLFISVASFRATRCTWLHNLRGICSMLGFSQAFVLLFPVSICWLAFLLSCDWSWLVFLCVFIWSASWLWFGNCLLLFPVFFEAFPLQTANDE
jgi:hypothetical protein